MFLASEQSQHHLGTQMVSVHAPRQCFSGNLQDRIAENTHNQPVVNLACILRGYLGNLKLILKYAISF